MRPMSGVLNVHTFSVAYDLEVVDHVFIFQILNGSTIDE